MTDFSAKYSESYFLGGRDSNTGKSYGLPGYKKFNNKKEHQRFKDLYHFIQSFADIIQGKDILEVGFGRGELIPFLLKEKCHHYHGIELSKVALKIAQDRYPARNVTLEVQEVQNLTKNQTYDLIILNNVIEHIPTYEMERVWKNIKNALRPGGFIILGTRLYDHPNEADETDKCQETSGLHCNKQTKETILRACLDQQLIIGKINTNTVGFVCQEHLPMFPDKKKEALLFTHKKILSKVGFSFADDPSKENLRKLVPNAGRVLIGCVTENNSKYYERTLRLVQSIRWFGGHLAGANIFVCFVDTADPSYVEELRKWGVFVRIVKRFSKSHPPSNKLRLFELPETDFYDTIMFLDCDTVIVQDPTTYIDAHHFQAKIANGPSVPYNVFRKLFKHYRLPIPRQDYLTSNKGLKTIWYCNTGVLIFPQPILRNFFHVWKTYTADLAGKRGLMKKSHAFCEQASLSLAFIKHPIPFKRLTNQMNCPMREDVMDPVIIHYRNAILNNGELKIRKSTSVLLANRIKEFNQRLRIFRERKE